MCGKRWQAVRTNIKKPSAPKVNCSCDCTKFKQNLIDFMMKDADDLKTFAFWRGVIGELIASFFLVLVGCGSHIETNQYPLVIRVALAFGFMYAILVYCLRHVSGAHINPVVTIAMTILCKISIARMACYIIAQLLGAILGAGILYGVTPEQFRGVLGATVPAQGVTEGQGFGVEFFSTLILVFITFACFEEHSEDEERRCPGHLIIGLTVAALTCFSLPLTGGSFNPARSFGPAAVRGIWTKHWIYWFGTILGGILGAAMYDVIFSKQTTLTRLVTRLTKTKKRANDPECPPPIELKDKKDIEGATDSEIRALNKGSNEFIQDLQAVSIEDIEKGKVEAV